MYMYVYICTAEEKKHDGILFFSQVPLFTTERSQTRRNTTITDNNNNSFVPIVWTRAGIQTDNLQLTQRCLFIYFVVIPSGAFPIRSVKLDPDSSLTF